MIAVNNLNNTFVNCITAENSCLYLITLLIFKLQIAIENVSDCCEYCDKISPFPLAGQI